MGFIEQYMLQLNTEKRRWRRSVAILTVLSLVVALVTVWNLRMTGVTIANSASCGYEEHQHTPECVAETTLICGYNLQEASIEEIGSDATEETAGVTEESTGVTEETTEATEETTTATEETTEATEETGPGAVHIHTDACHAVVYSCGLEEHIHKITCFSDPSADVETAKIWEQSLPDELGDHWSENLVRVAVSQIGVAESEKNYILANDGETKQGITRYGQWYGNPYGDWSSMFVMFCLHYAEIPQESVPWSPGVYNMMRLAQDAQIFLSPDENLGCRGNLLFLDTDENSNADRLIVVSAHENGSITAIGGDWENTLSVYKVDAESNTALTGAEFGLYRKENGVYLLVQTLTTGIDGHITFLNLETDTLYRLVEEKPPNGYAVIAKEIFFTLRPNGSTLSIQFYDSAGNVISAPNGVSGEYITGNKLLTVTVKNLRGYELPSTGGTGIFFHILCGLFLVSAPLVYGLSLRRKYERRSQE